VSAKAAIRGGNAIRRDGKAVADDELALRDALGRALSSEGYEVAFARDGRETLLAVERDELDAAVLDVMMPPDGLEVCRSARSFDACP
jgi:two-component system response regulator MprA